MAAHLDDRSTDLAAQIAGQPVEGLAGLGVAGTDLAAEIDGDLAEGVTKLGVHRPKSHRAPVPCQCRKVDTVPAPGVHYGRATRRTEDSMLKGKKVIALGERDGIQGGAIAACARAAGAEVVLEKTYCFV